MTICLAATCSNGQVVVVASDRMLSAPFLTLEFDHPDAKISRLSASCVGMSSGDALVATDLMSGFDSLVSQLQDPQVAMIADQVRTRFVELRRKLIKERLFDPRGISFEAFYQRGLINSFPSDLSMMLDSQVQNMSLSASVLVAGVDSSGAHIFCIDDPGTSACYDRLGYHAIGSGHRHALLTLVMLQHRVMLGVNQAVHYVYEAKRQSELAPGVGQATEMRIISQGGIRVVTADELSTLEEAHKLRVAPEMREVTSAIAALPFEEGSKMDDDTKAAAD